MSTSTKTKNLIHIGIFRLIWPAVDLLIWVLSAQLALIIRFEKVPNPTLIMRGVFFSAALGIAFRVLLFLEKRLFGSYLRYSSDEIISFSKLFLILIFLGTAFLFRDNGEFLPRSFAILLSICSFTLMLGARFYVRLFRRKKSPSSRSKTAFIYGAGFYSEMVIRQMLDRPKSDWHIYGLIDDDLGKVNSKILGIRVLGNSENLERLIQKYHPDSLVVAMANIKPEKLKKVDLIAEKYGVAVSIVPSLSALLGKQFQLSDIKPLDESDLIGRKFIDVDIDFLQSHIKDKRIIVTGAGGSIGSELSRQLNSLKPAFLGLLDRDESGLLNTQLSIDNQGLLNTPNLILADIRDVERLEEIFKTHKPDLVFHAAALKHLPLLQANPMEAWKTNVVGTLNLLELSNKYQVETFVNISTDKAADPISILGHSKLMTEQLTSYYGQMSTRTKFVSVRFGNVFGSRGSVIGTFNHQINANGPVIVTGPGVTRFFMTIHEAVHLVLRASRIGTNGDTLVLNMGMPVNILSIAEKLIQRSGKKVEVSFSGLREGEKEHETLFASHEKIEKTEDPMISKTRVEELESIALEKLESEYIERIRGKNYFIH